MNENLNANPMLTDIFRTALEKAAPKAPPPVTPRVVIHGNNNIVSYGGAVYIKPSPTAPTRGRSK